MGCRVTVFLSIVVHGMVVEFVDVLVVVLVFANVVIVESCRLLFAVVVVAS